MERKELRLKIAAVSVLCAIVLSVVAWATTWGVLATRFYRGCSSHIQRAATTTSLEVAKSELDLAIAYAEKMELTEGNSSLSGKNPSGDIAFWYTNLKHAREKLNSVSQELLDESNVLMEVRESLTINSGTDVRLPIDIECYHHNGTLAIMECLFFGTLIVFVVYFSKH